MTIQGQFVVNNADYSPLSIFGVGTFMAYSGKADYRNHTGCVDVPNVGPIPQGRYHIVSRPTGGWKGVVSIPHNRAIHI